ncbi:MAG: DUF1572 family protein [Ginsengibacter sp.]
MSSSYLESVKKQFSLYRSLGEKTINLVEEEKLFWRYNPESNSISVIVQHLWGNMLSRWTHFLTEDGEKEWRNRDTEFEEVIKTKEELLIKWNAGWDCLFNTLLTLKSDDLDRTIYIRTEPLTAMDAINRQLAHYASHVGQIIFLGKMILGDRWISLSIPRGKSHEYNMRNTDSSTKK